MNLEIAYIGLRLYPQSAPIAVKKPHIREALKFGVADGARTHDNRNHNPLSYSLHRD